MSSRVSQQRLRHRIYTWLNDICARGRLGWQSNKRWSEGLRQLGWCKCPPLDGSFGAAPQEAFELEAKPVFLANAIELFKNVGSKSRKVARLDAQILNVVHFAFL